MIAQSRACGSGGRRWKGRRQGNGVWRRRENNPVNSARIAAKQGEAFNTEEERRPWRATKVGDSAMTVAPSPTLVAFRVKKSCFAAVRATPWAFSPRLPAARAGPDASQPSRLASMSLVFAAHERVGHSFAGEVVRR